MRDNGRQAQPSDWGYIEEPATALFDKIAKWSDVVRDQVNATRIEDIALPEDLSPWGLELWRSLMRVAMAAGGDWPAKTTELAMRYVADAELDADSELEYESPHVALVRDVAAVWPDGRAFISSESLCINLQNHNPREWKTGGPTGQPLTTTGMAKMLNRWHIRSAKPSTGDRSKGYSLRDFTKAFAQVGAEGPTPEVEVEVDAPAFV